MCFLMSRCYYETKLVVLCKENIKGLTNTIIFYISFVDCSDIYRVQTRKNSAVQPAVTLLYSTRLRYSMLFKPIRLAYVYK